MKGLIKKEFPRILGSVNFVYFMIQVETWSFQQQWASEKKSSFWELESGILATRISASNSYFRVSTSSSSYEL